MGKPHLLKNLRVSEISLVDAPANQGAMHLLFKRKGLTMPKEPSALERMLAKLGLSKRGNVDDKTPDPDTYSDAAGTAIDKAAAALNTSIASILADEKITDKAGEIAKQTATMRAHLGDEVAAQIEKAMRDVAVVSLEKSGDPNMPTMDELAAQLAALTKRADSAEFELAKSKLPAETQAYIADVAMSAEDQAVFVKASAEDQAKTMKDKPPAKKKVPEADPEMAKRDATIAEMAKSIATFQAERELSDMRKRAADVGLPEAQAEVLLKASKGDADAFGKLMDLVKANKAQAKTDKLFGEFGSTRVSKEGSATAEMDAKVVELTKADPTKTASVARAEIMKKNPDLFRRVRAEEMSGASA
jgi:hypothetical protein